MASDAVPGNAGGDEEGAGQRHPAGAELDAAASTPPRRPTRWERTQPIVLPVAVAFAAKAAMLLLAYVMLDRPDDFWQRIAWNWDGEHYIGIAMNGYAYHFDGSGDSVHFAFLYPLLIRAFGGSPVAAVAINNVLSLAAVAVVAWHWGPRAGTALALFPAWLVYGTVAYSEGTFVFLAAVAIIALERGWQAFGGVAAGMAACARYLGGPALLLAAFPWRAWRFPRRYVAFALVSLSGLALCVWMWYQTGEVLGYYESQKPWGGKVAWPWAHFDWLLHGWFTLQGGPIQGGNLSPIDFVLRDVLFAIPIVSGLVLLWRRGAAASPSFAYSLAIFLTALCTSGTPAAAFPRYVAVAFPAIAVLGASIRHPWAWTAYVIAGVMMAAHGLSHHLFGYWS
ncbi:MAG TPA: hypothetical protein VM327_10020 [Candidatus Thermoplasmatota archaeon]|nr:hypothetical protein [Candidatus Thermoplasmatota archaeon]